MKITLKDVAEAAGVSRSAVSRAFTEGAPVSPEMKARVLEAAEALGYTPNALASSLTTGKTGLIGLLVDDFAAPGIARLLDEVSVAVQDKGLHPLLINLSGIQTVADARRFLDAYAVDGAIVVSRDRTYEFAEALQTESRPVVHCFGRPAAEAQVHQATVDFVRFGRIAARNLIDAGHKSLGFIGGGTDHEITMDALQGFEQVCTNRKVVARVWQADGLTAQDGYEEMMVSLKSEPCEAYFCLDEDLTKGAMMACRDQGLAVPGDVAVIGLSGSAKGGTAADSIVVPAAQMARFASNMLEKSISTPGLAPRTKAFGGRLLKSA